MLRVHLFLNLSCRQDSEQLESVALTMLHVSGGRRKIKRVCGRQRGRVKQGRGRGVWKPSPDREKRMPRSERMQKNRWRGRCIWVRRAKEEKEAGHRNWEPASRAETSASPSVQEQGPEALPLRDPVKLLQRPDISTLRERQVNGPHSHSRELRQKLAFWLSDRGERESGKGPSP